MARDRRPTSLGVATILAAALALAAPQSSAARLVISPATITVNLDKGRASGTFQLTNLGSETERYRAKAIHFALSDQGGLQILPPGELSLATWIRFNPTEFELPPNARRVIRYSVLPPKDAEEGEYWGGIEFEPLAGALSNFTDAEGRNFNITVVSAALVTIFGQKGPARYDLEVAGASLETSDNSTILRIRLQNTGMGKLNLNGGDFELTTKGGSRAAKGELPQFPLLRQGSRDLEVPLSPALEPGEYQLQLSVAARQFEAPYVAKLPIALTE